MTVDHNTLNLLDKVRAVVLAAGDIIRTRAELPRQVRHKSRIDLVTDTDIAVENFLKQHLHSLCPQATFLAEESASGESLGEYAWIIDPVDGTTNFVHGLPHVATSVALWHDTRVILGVVNAPLLDECYTAVCEGGAWRNATPLRVSAVDALQDALVATGFPYSFDDGALPDIMRRLRALLPLAQGVRRCGSAALDMAYVAAGRYDAYYEQHIHVWDIAAGCLLVQEAGGLATALRGAPLRLDCGNDLDILADNGKIHQSVLALLA